MIRRDWTDIGFTGLYDDQYKYVDVVANFTVFKHEGWDETDAPLFWRADENSNINPTSRPEEAEPFLTCGIKWDGCSNWNFSQGIHLCARRDAAEIGLLMLRLYDWAKEVGQDRL